MRHFQQLASGVNIGSLSHAIMRQPSLWNANRLRTTFPGTPFTEVDDIILRFQSGIIGADGPITGDDLECGPYPAWPALPQVAPLVLGLMQQIGGIRLGRVVITRLPPGGRIAPHRDIGALYAEYYQRYHVVINGEPGSLFQAGDEQVCMVTGDIWWFDASQEHACYNNSAGDRIHLLVDARPL